MFLRYRDFDFSTADGGAGNGCVRGFDLELETGVNRLSVGCEARTPLVAAASAVATMTWNSIFAVNVARLAMVRLERLSYRRVGAARCSAQGQSLRRAGSLIRNRRPFRLQDWVGLKVMEMERNARAATLVPQALVCEREVALVLVKVIPVLVNGVVPELDRASFASSGPRQRRREE